MIKTIKELQQEYAEWCGYKNFEELRKKDEKALEIWYLKTLEPIGDEKHEKRK